MITAKRYHDFSAGHRVYGHESKCANSHGHNYRAHFTVQADKLDTVGRVLDFSVIKTSLCQWLEDNWDHKFLLWENDPWVETMRAMDPYGLIAVPFNPTAENMAHHLLHIVGPSQLKGLPCTLIEVVVEETRKCGASASLKYVVEPLNWDPKPEPSKQLDLFNDFQEQK